MAEKADWRVFRRLNPQGMETHQTEQRKGYCGLQPLGTSGDHEKSVGNWELVWLTGTEVPAPRGMQALGRDCGSGLGC